MAHARIGKRQAGGHATARLLSTNLLLAAAVLGAGCRSAPKPAGNHIEVGWRPTASFSGRGDEQTESFNIESGQWRIKWETKHESPAGAGSFRVVVHSAVSGRPLQVAVEHRGPGQGIAYVNEHPRLYHLVIESANMDWSVAVQEAVVAQY